MQFFADIPKGRAGPQTQLACLLGWPAKSISLIENNRRGAPWLWERSLDRGLAGKHRGEYGKISSLLSTNYNLKKTGLAYGNDFIIPDWNTIPI
jgi:hypothetical protein